MEIVSSDSEEDVASEMIDNQVTITDSAQEETRKGSRSIAWLCFDRKNAFQKLGKEYVKCN
jgi:hypothetical protein